MTNTSQRKCALCKRESTCEWYPGVDGKPWLCVMCGQKCKVRHLYRMYIEQKEKSIREAILKLHKEGYVRKDIQFILDLSDDDFIAEVERLRNLKHSKEVYRQLIEEISQKQEQK